MSLQAARRRKQAILRWVVVGLVLTFFALPLFGMLEFTTRGAGGSGRSLDTWPSWSTSARSTPTTPTSRRA